MKRVFVILCFSVGVLLLCACAGGDNDAPVTADTVAVVTPDAPAESPLAEPQVTPAPEPEAPQQSLEESDNPELAIPATGEVIISFEYTRQTGPASNQHAVWIEDIDGNLVKSLFASQWTATGGFTTRPDSIALWASRADLANMSSEAVDAVAGATPRTGQQSYVWDLTDLNGNTVDQADYIFFVEGTLRWKNFVLFSGVITVGDAPFTVHGDAVFHYEDSERYAALTVDSVENNMIGPVTAIFTP